MTVTVCEENLVSDTVNRSLRTLRLYFFIAAHIVQVAQLMLFNSARHLGQSMQQ